MNCSHLVVLTAGLNLLPTRSRARWRGVCSLQAFQSSLIPPSSRTDPRWGRPSWLKLHSDWLMQSESCRHHNSWNYSVAQPRSPCRAGSCSVCVSKTEWQLTEGMRYIKRPLWLVGFQACGDSFSPSAADIHNICFASFEGRDNQSAVTWGDWDVPIPDTFKATTIYCEESKVITAKQDPAEPNTPHGYLS